MSRKTDINKLTIISVAVVLNIIGAFVAVTFRLPIFIDTIGTILISFIFGPSYGMLTGICTSLVNGLSFDPYSLYFMPVQMIIGLVSGLLYKKGLFKEKLIFLGTIIVTVIGSITAAIISAYVFSGITSSGTSFITMYLKEAGINIVASVFSTQILFDLLDKAVVISIVLYFIKRIPKEIKKIIFKSKNKS